VVEDVRGGVAYLLHRQANAARKRLQAAGFTDVTMLVATGGAAG